ncbi:MAG TPA: hypothetical protein VMD53_11090 [Rhizomicrobium sp.]|nr:hypothetical protein [Rhizomicrobium sp.]
MHHFMIMHVAMLLIVAFFIFFAAQKADGLISLFGYVLGVLLLLGAVLHIVGMFVPGFMGMKPGMHDGMMRGHWMMHHQDAAGVPSPTAAPAKPAPAAPAPAPKKP